MEKLEIGVATISYNEQGVSIAAGFESSVKISAANATPLLQELQSISGTSKENIVIEQANLLVGEFFQTIDKIDLADREKFEVVGDKISCTKHANGNIKEVKVKYYFRIRPVS